MPLPWEGDRLPFGFGADGVVPWLPQPPGWAGLTVAAQAVDPESMLSLYRAALRLRRELPALRSEPLTWIDVGANALAFGRGPSFRCGVNVSGPPLDVSAHGAVVLASGPCGDLLPPDTAAWFSAGGG